MKPAPGPRGAVDRPPEQGGCGTRPRISAIGIAARSYIDWMVAARSADAPAPAGDLAAHYRRAAALAGAGRLRDALDELLALVERDRRWRDQAARKAMLAIFAHLGVRSPISDEYRKRLALLL